MRRFHLLLFFFVLGLYLSGGYIWAQALPVSEGHFSDPISHSDEPARHVEDKYELQQMNEEPGPVRDPLEGYNRIVFTFNDKLYFYALKPLSNGYKLVLPERARVSVKNLYSNISMPIRFVNCLLQGKFRGAGTEALRLVINSTMGMGGLFDPAKSYFHLEKQEEDFGQTLGRYGLGPVLYIEWPLLGPSSLRDTLGLAADVALDPLTYLIGSWEGFGVGSYDYINELSLDKDTYEGIVEPAIDPYLAILDAYIENRNKWINE